MNKSYLMTVEKRTRDTCCYISSAVWELVPIVCYVQKRKNVNGNLNAASGDVVVQGNTAK